MAMLQRYTKRPSHTLSHPHGCLRIRCNPPYYSRVVAWAQALVHAIEASRSSFLLTSVRFAPRRTCWLTGHAFTALTPGNPTV